jgi:hypothetical protein
MAVSASDVLDGFGVRDTHSLALARVHVLIRELNVLQDNSRADLALEVAEQLALLGPKDKRDKRASQFLSTLKVATATKSRPALIGGQLQLLVDLADETARRGWAA